MNLKRGDRVTRKVGSPMPFPTGMVVDRMFDPDCVQVREIRREQNGTFSVLNRRVWVDPRLVWKGEGVA